MSLRLALLPIEDLVESLFGPTTLAGNPGLDLRPYSLTVQQRVWPGRPGSGTPADNELVITPVPEIMQLSLREIASSGGTYRQGDIRVGPITPKYSTGGYDENDLRPVATDHSTEIIHVVTGEFAGNYTLVEFSSDEAGLEYHLVLRRRGTSP